VRRRRIITSVQSLVTDNTRCPMFLPLTIPYNNYCPFIIIFLLNSQLDPIPHHCLFCCIFSPTNIFHKEPDPPLTLIPNVIDDGNRRQLLHPIELYIYNNSQRIAKVRIARKRNTEGTVDREVELILLSVIMTHHASRCRRNASETSCLESAPPTCPAPSPASYYILYQLAVLELRLRAAKNLH